MVCRTGGCGNEGHRIGGMQELKDTGKKGCRKGEIQEWRDTGKEGYRN